MTFSPSWEMLVLGGTVLTMEEGAEPIPDGAIAITDGRIAAVGPAEEMLEQAPTGEVVNATNCLILPGLVNTHSHLAMSVLRGIAEDLPLKEWLEQHIWPAEREHMSRETVRIGTLLAAAEQLMAGITTTTDMYFFADETARAIAEAGMRGVIAEAVIDFATPRCATAEEMMAKQRELADAFKGHPLVVPSLAAHSPYTVCAANLVKEAELADELGIPLQIHLAETRWEVDEMMQSKGMSPVAYLADLGVLSEGTIASHCVHVSPQDIETLAELEVGVAHNPVSNLKLASGIAPVHLMLERGVKLGLGTDGPVSNNTLDLFRDLRLTALVHKMATNDATTLPARTVLELATAGGARVLGLEDRIGTLREGKEADLICISIDGPHASPMYDPFSHLVYSARAADVQHVMVRGKVVVRNHKLETLDEEAICADAREVAARIAQGRS